MSVVPSTNGWWCLVARTSDGGCDATLPAAFETKGGSVLKQLASATVSHHDITASGTLEVLGAGTTTVTLWAGSDENSLEPVSGSSKVLSTAGSFSVTGTVLGDPHLVYWKLVSVNVAPGGTTWTSESPVYTITTEDAATYTWKAEKTEGDWDDPANWTVSGVKDANDVLGYPDNAKAKVRFVADTTAEIADVRRHQRRGLPSRGRNHEHRREQRLDEPLGRPDRRLGRRALRHERPLQLEHAREPRLDAAPRKRRGPLDGREQRMDPPLRHQHVGRSGRRLPARVALAGRQHVGRLRPVRLRRRPEPGGFPDGRPVFHPAALRHRAGRRPGPPSRGRLAAARLRLLPDVERHAGRHDEQRPGLLRRAGRRLRADPALRGLRRRRRQPEVRLAQPERRQRRPDRLLGGQGQPAPHERPPPGRGPADAVARRHRREERPARGPQGRAHVLHLRLPADPHGADRRKRRQNAHVAECGDRRTPPRFHPRVGFPVISLQNSS